MMATALHARYPSVILSHDAYLKFSNSEKYRAASAAAPALTLPSATTGDASVAFVGDTCLTRQATCLFSALHLNTTDQTAAEQLSEFRSRITYLAFPKAVPTRAEATAYLRKMIDEFGHMSVLAGSQLVLALAHTASHALALDQVCVSVCLLPIKRGFGDGHLFYLKETQ